ncbi:DUF5686 and carboxypeptidase regulatory-like domain-containing protein [Tenacibaculum xiamenense]|uniref:DUF5686 and carboxypeptidase regulatory-like domain-containing protein n=1 Tax=Tenacibaculum xiamenense TaxID=1261553 RepID=UPI003894F800
MRKIITFILLTSVFSSFAQLKGKVSDKNGTPLPFVSVYLEGSITGTITNNSGDYFLDIKKPGDYVVVFQFLGYKTAKKKISFSKYSNLNITLIEEQVTLSEVQINSKENPANRIIRNAIASKDKNTDKLGKYTANFYSRGLFKIKNAPEKFLGEEIGDLGGGLDSTRSGVIYLSETISNIKYQKNPKRFKEHIIASKVAGQDNGISFNRADEVNFDLYENSFDLADAQMVSPIANSAFGYYNYKLAGTIYDDNGKLINKIQLIPKRKNDRVFSGHIYIVEDDWAVYGTDVTVSGTQVGIPLIKELKIKQNYNYVKESNAWAIVTQTIDFEAGILGFNFEGRFSAAYSNYNFTPNFKTSSFTNEVLSFAENATKKDSVYWNTIRPMPLTQEEVSDYKLKDSIKVLRKSKRYLDSVDNKQNKFELLDILTGYTYEDTYNKWSVSFSSPIEKLGFNTVQGWNSSIGVDYSKRYNDKGKRLNMGLDVNYGSSDERLRPSGHLSYKWNNKTYPILSVSGGVTTAQFNAKNPISPFWNTISSIFYQRNYMKIYEKTFAKVSFSREAVNGIRVFSSLEYARRNPLFNTTNYVMFPEDDVEYTSNNPQEPNNFDSSFTSHNMWTMNLGASIRFGQKYLSYPDSKINIPNSKYPSLYVGYRKNFGSGNSQWDSDVVFSELNQSINLGNLGRLSYKAKGGIFLEKKDIPFMDYAHFNGNRLTIAPNSNYLDGFFSLPFYDLSTNDRYGELHVEQNFKGAVLSRIPLINELNFYLVAGAKGLFTGGNRPYSEFSIGLDNVGFGKWRFMRVDFVRSNFNGTTENRFLIGFKL